MDNSFRRRAFSILYRLLSIPGSFIFAPASWSAAVLCRFCKFSILYPLFSLFAFVFAGCATAPLPPTNLSAPGWTVQQGQAVWKPTASRPEIAGDLLMATNTDGDCFIQFTKTPFTLATAQLSGGRWQLQFGNDQYSWRGNNPPPKRFVWFQLPRSLAGAPIAPDWQFRSTTNGWEFNNPQTGESLEGGFFQ